MPSSSPHGEKKEDCESEITQNAFLWEEGERKGIEKSRRQNYMSGVRICSRFTRSIVRERENEEASRLGTHKHFKEGITPCKVHTKGSD